MMCDVLRCFMGGSMQSITVLRHESQLSSCSSGIVECRMLASENAPEEIIKTVFVPGEVQDVFTVESRQV